MTETPFSQYSSSIEFIQPKNKRWKEIDQAIVLAEMLPVDHPTRIRLLANAAEAWCSRVNPVAILKSESAQ